MTDIAAPAAPSAPAARFTAPTDIETARDQLQTAIAVEFGTLPPYLYCFYSIPIGDNGPAADLIRSVFMEEMVHLCLASNILNALGGDPVLVPPRYPGELPGHIGPDGHPVTVSLLPFSKAAMAQAMAIEQPEHKPDFPHARFLLEEAPKAVTIGQFYAALDTFLATLGPGDWSPGRHQIDDNQFLTGQLFPINGYADAHRAISVIVSEGEGTGDNPLDFGGEPAHFFRFGEIFYDQVLTRTTQAPGYQWGPQKLGVDWSKVYAAIADPQQHDFSADPPAAQAAQAACTAAYTRLIDTLRLALTGQPDQLGLAVRAMFDLSLAAQAALQAPLADGHSVAGPAFLYGSTGGAA